MAYHHTKNRELPIRLHVLNHLPGKKYSNCGGSERVTTEIDKARETSRRDYNLGNHCDLVRETHSANQGLIFE